MECSNKRRLAISLIKDEINKYGVMTRKKAMKLYMNATGENEINGSISAAVTAAIAILIKDGFMVAKEKGLYIKV